MKYTKFLLVGLMLFTIACFTLSLSEESPPDENAIETAVAETLAAQPTDTDLPPTDVPQPAVLPTATERNEPIHTATLSQPATAVPGLATVNVVNNLSVQLTVKLKGPEIRTFIIKASARMEIEVEPGAYEYSLSAPGFNSAYGSIVFDPGENTWTIGKTNN